MDQGQPRGAASAAEPGGGGSQQERIEATYTLEAPVKCPSCHTHVSALKAVRLLRSHVNFTSTLPRRGRVLICPECHAIVPAELTNF
jgi:hypothetical protein